MTETSDVHAETESVGNLILPDTDKLEALAEFAAGAGHEINNPLATIIGRAQLLLQNESDPKRRQMLMAIGAQAYRIRDMIGDTMLFGRPPKPNLRPTNLLEIVSQVVGKFHDDPISIGCKVQVAIAPEITLSADPVQLAIVTAELLRNSRQALKPDGGEIQITARIESTAAIIEFIDYGIGFSELERRHAFDPFFSGRQAGRGLGFGLPKCWRVIDQHHGQIHIESALGLHTRVRIHWPLQN